MVEPRMHAVAVELDFVQPLIAFRRRVDQLRELRRDPFRQSGRAGARRARYGARHDGELVVPVCPMATLAVITCRVIPRRIT
jgi:hypothetical protein